MKDLEDILRYQPLDEGLITNAVKQVGAKVANTVNKVTTSVNDAVANSNEKTKQAQGQAQTSKVDAVISGKTGISVKGEDKATKATIAILNAMVKAIDGKISQAKQPSQVSEALAMASFLTTGRLSEADNISALNKLKTTITSALSSGVISGKIIQSLAPTFEKVVGNTDLSKKLSQAYSSAVETQFKQYQDKKKGTNPQPAQTPVNGQAKQGQPTEQKPAEQQAPGQTQQTPAKPEQPTEQKPDQKAAASAQDVVKKCSNALGQISSSIDAIKTKMPNGNFGQPSKDGFYASVEGSNFIDQVKTIISKVSTDLGAYTVVQESFNPIEELKKLNEQIIEARASLEKL